MIVFFQTQNKNKLVKEATKLLMPDIAINQKLYVPMLAKPFDMPESNTYCDLRDESLDMIQPEQLNLNKKLRYYVYHTNE